MNHLATFWFILIAVLWTGFFILEGFDFGVGMLHSAVGRDDAGRRAAINTIGPLWDGNEVWLVVAGASMFAAFPGWYATMFSAFNLALVLLLAALIARGLSFEYRGKRDAHSWRRTWDTLLTVGSVLAPLLIGVALGDLLHGLPINSAHNYTGSFWDLLQPYGLWTGVTLVLVCLLHGATFLSLKTTDDMRERAGRMARRAAPVTAAAVVGFTIWTHVIARGTFFLNPIELLAVLAVLAAVWLVYEHREGFAFAATTVTIASCIVSIFVGLYPNVMVSTTNAAYNLTAQNSASAAYSLKVMTIVAIVLLPLVLAYQTWTYYVFRKRVSKQQFESPTAPAAPSPEPAPQPASPPVTSGS
jgi:cytochrome bd-type quinol oxidase subunit 2